MSKHTPGPWEDAREGWIDSFDGQSVIEYAGCGSHEALYGNPADKTLILAAPDLLEACESLINIELIDVVSVGPLREALNKARAAIAKAKGEQA